MRPHALTPGALLLGLALLAGLALAPVASAAPEDRDAICQSYRGTALWGQCTRAVDNGCHESEFAHPQCARWEAQWKAQTDVLPPWLLACGIGSKCVFVTSATYTGNLGGLSGADAKCEALAGSEGSLAAPGNYKAWLSDSTASPSTRFDKADVPYRLVDGSQVAADWDDLIDGELETGIELDEAEGRVPVEIVWTGTFASGARLLDDPSAYCDDWLSADSLVNPANFGASGQTGRGWTHIPNSGDARCEDSSYLYCFQQ